MTDSKSNLRSSIVDAINKVRTDTGRNAIEPEDNHTLTGEIGLDSLDLAVLVVTLQKALGVDPFRDGSATARTLGELVEVYQQSVS